jgi:2-keto-4-pentenoate hydratase/2-oxohepta-3-ene-1,7-dioic acid hydratase in catechol pathway
MLTAMRIYRYRVDKASYYGDLVSGNILRRCVRMSPSKFELKHAGPEDKLEDVELLVPAVPSKIICVGRNYADHAREMGNAPVSDKPLLFLKPPSCLIPHGAEIELPEQHEKVDYEGEIALVISERCRHVPAERAYSYLLGVTAFNDVTERIWQKGDGQWTRGKGCDTFGPCGPFIDTSAAEALREGGEDRTPLTVKTLLNGEQVQYGEITDLTFGFAFLISYISRYMTLEAGDLIATGTPAGVGQLNAGDRVAVELSCGVRLENGVSK